MILGTDESESFYIEGGLPGEEVVKKINKIWNRAEAFFQATLRYHKTPEVDSENWEEGRDRLYRIKLKTRDVYRDEPNVRRLSRTILSKNYIVFEAEDGKQAIEISNSQKPDVILMDMMMPKMDGLTAFLEIKKIRP